MSRRRVITIELNEATGDISSRVDVAVTQDIELLGRMFAAVTRSTAKGVCLETGQPAGNAERLESEIAKHYLDALGTQPPAEIMIRTGG